MLTQQAAKCKLVTELAAIKRDQAPAFFYCVNLGEYQADSYSFPENKFYIIPVIFLPTQTKEQV